MASFGVGLRLGLETRSGLRLTSYSGSCRAWRESSSSHSNQRGCLKTGGLCIHRRWLSMMSRTHKMPRLKGCILSASIMQMQSFHSDGSLMGRSAEPYDIADIAFHGSNKADQSETFSESSCWKKFLQAKLWGFHSPENEPWLSSGNNNKNSFYLCQARMHFFSATIL